MQRKRKKRRDTIDELRARVWFGVVAFLSGGTSKQQLWQDIGFSRSTWYNYAKGTVPSKRLVDAIECRYAGTRQILNANVWNILQGKRVSTLAIQNEFRGFNSELTADYEILDLNFWSDNAAIEYPKLLYKIASLTGEGDDDGLHFQIILNLMSLVRDTDVEIWNELCCLYRALFPDFATQIHWPFKAEIFDAVDDYVRLREKRGVSIVEDLSDTWSWRDRKLDILSVLDEHYLNQLYAYVRVNLISPLSLPKGLIDDVSSRLSFEVCSEEKLMFHSWRLWEPAAILLSKVFNERMIENNQITPEFCLGFLEKHDFFCPYDQELLNYDYLMFLAQDTKLRLNHIL